MNLKPLSALCFACCLSGSALLGQDSDLSRQAVPATTAPARTTALAHWQSIATGVSASSRGLSALSSQVAWVGGSEGTVLRTIDGGQHWTRHAVPGAEELEFRDIEAFDAQTAVLMTAGQPARLYTTDDGGASFTLAHESPFKAAFFDGMAFWDSQRGVVMSDPVEGHLLVLTTEDAGKTWQRVPVEALPAVVDGEAGFAASGTNIAVADESLVWIGTGGAMARVMYSTDGGTSWQVTPTPLRSGTPSSGIFSIAFRDSRHGVAVGGDYQEPESRQANAALSRDGGKTWQAITGDAPRGHRACVVHLPKHGAQTWLAVGRAGTDLSTDDGESWQALSDEGFYTASIAPDGTVWAAGDQGRVALLVWHQE